MKPYLLILTLSCGLALAQTHNTINIPTSTVATSDLLYRGGSTIFGAKSELILSKQLKDGKLVLEMKSHEDCMAAVYPACPGHDRQWREVYGVSNGVIVLLKTIEAQVIPAQGPSVKWPE